MIGKTNTGSALKAFAIIGVTYPTGSVCTCTDGTKTLTLKDTSGLGIFLIPYAATWTVSCTDGTKTANQEVSITAEGQSESVTLTYELVLFDKDAGINRTDLTGGFELYDGYVGFNKSLDSTGGYGIMSGSKVADIANHSTLVVETGDITAPLGAYMGIASNTASAPKHVYSAMTAKVSISSNGIYNLDISSITSSAYIALCCYNDGAGHIGMVMRAKRIYLQ